MTRSTYQLFRSDAEPLPERRQLCSDVPWTRECWALSTRDLPLSPDPVGEGPCTHKDKHTPVYRWLSFVKKSTASFRLECDFESIEYWNPKRRGPASTTSRIDRRESSFRVLVVFIWKIKQQNHHGFSMTKNLNKLLSVIIHSSRTI